MAGLEELCEPVKHRMLAYTDNTCPTLDRRA